MRRLFFSKNMRTGHRFWVKASAVLVAGVLLTVGTSEVYAYLAGRTLGGSPAAGSLYNMRQPAAVNNGLVAHYKFDGDATDSVQTAKNDLTDNNTVTQTTGPGGVGNAAQFTSANSESLSIVDNPSVRTSSSNRTIAAWVYLDSKPAGATIISKGGASNSLQEYELKYESASDRFMFMLGDGTNAVGCSASSFGSPSTGTWYYIVGWADLNTRKTYIQVDNGTVDEASASASLSFSYTDTNNFSIGARPLGSNYFNGRIARAGLWKRVLTSTERTALYNSGSGKYLRELTGPQKQGLVSYWDLEEASGTRYDNYGAVLHGVNDGTPTNFNWDTTDGYVEGKFGKALKFDGTNDFVSQGSNASLNITGNLTTSFWIKATGAGIYCIICGHNPADGATGYQVWLNYASAGKFRFKSGNVTADTTYASGNDGNWHHFAASLDGTTVSIYVDGVLDSSPTVGVPTSWTGVHSIGAKNDGNNPTAGTLDDVRIYNRALTAAEITTLYGSSNPPAIDQSLVGYWKFDDAAANTTVAEFSGNGHTGTAQRNTNLTSTNGIYAQGFTFAGSDYIDVGSGATLNITGDISLTMWINPSAVLGCIVGFFNSGDATTGYSAWVHYSANKFRFSSGGVSTDSNASVTDGNWHFVAVSLSGTSLKMYIDGILDKSVTGGVPTSFTGNRYIGAKNNGTLPYYGKLDELRVYKRTLEPYEIAEMYRNGRP